MADQDSDDDYDEDQKKLDTVREGTESNPAVTDQRNSEKKLRSSSSAGLAGLRDINDLDGTDKDSEEEEVYVRCWHSELVHWCRALFLSIIYTCT